MRVGPVLRSLGLVALGAVALAAFAEAQGERDGDPARGERLVTTNCGGCHAVGKVGESPVPAAPAFRTLSQRYPVENLEEALAEGILVGHESEVQMPEFTFAPEDVADIIAHLKIVQIR